MPTKLRSINLCLYKLRQQIRLRPRLDLVHGTRKDRFRARSRWVALGDAVLGEFCDGHGGVPQAVFGGEKVERVLEKYEVEKGDLSNLILVVSFVYVCLYCNCRLTGAT